LQDPAGIFVCGLMRDQAPRKPGVPRRPSPDAHPSAVPGRHTHIGDQPGALQFRVQRKPAAEAAPTGASVVDTARRGVAGGGTALPHAAAIQASFGGAIDVGGIRAHVGGDAAGAAQAIGARAYAIGSDVAFAGAPDLHTAAHEAAHVVQQRAGVQLKSNVGEVGDAYERHADAVADAVVAGRSAAPLLATLPSGGGAGEAVQRATADVSYTIGDTTTQIAGQAVGMFSVGGVSHSEQRVWTASQNEILAALRRGDSVDVTFSVDTTICAQCTPWFENTVFTALRTANQTGRAVPGHAGATFQLHVTVNDHTVEVTGGNTIWPNEIADGPTWHRLGDFERMDRFLTDNRDENGDVRDEALSEHVASTHTTLQEQMQAGNIDGGDVEQCLANAIPDACRLQVAAYNFRTPTGAEDPQAMQAALAHITLFDIMRSGRLGSIPTFTWEAGADEWKRALTERFEWWLVDWIEENLDDRRIQAAY
jgi:Domain of unknown function (DUF4157)